MAEQPKKPKLQQSSLKLFFRPPTIRPDITTVTAPNIESDATLNDDDGVVSVPNSQPDVSEPCDDVALDTVVPNSQPDVSEPCDDVVLDTVAPNSQPDVSEPCDDVVLDTVAPNSQPDVPEPCALNDIGHAVGQVLTSEDRVKFLKPWTPQNETDFPCSYHVKSGRRRCRRLLSNHLKTFPWLGVSKLEHKKGAYCIPCVLFSASTGVGGRSDGRGIVPGKLVTKPLDRFDDLTGKNGVLNVHQNNQYHKDSVLAMASFEHVNVIQRDRDIRSQLDTQRREAIKHNRDVLRPIVDTILTCARQNIALRGHHDEEGSVSHTGEEPLQNDGNFRALLRYRIRSGDIILQTHAKNARKNATYQSASIQNDLIQTSGNLVKNKVTDKIKNSRFWSVIADETMDRQKREQLAIVIRYVDKDDMGKWQCSEDTVAVLDIYADIRAENLDPDDDEEHEVRLSGKAIGEAILRKVTELGLDLTKCIGQCYDGASTMSSERVGAAATFLEKAPSAPYFHCSMHSLNLCASQAIKVPSIRHAQDVVKEVSNCFRSSAKRSDLLKDTIRKADDTRIVKDQLVTLCTTRFVERHTAVVTLRALLRFVMAALSKMRKWQSTDARKTAMTLENSICQSEFIVGLVILETISGLLLPITRSLQTVAADLLQAMTSVKDVLDALKDLRTEPKFSQLFEEAKITAASLNIEICKPRTASRSTYRASAQGTDLSTESYYRINFFYPSLDHVIQDLELRFGDKQKDTVKINGIIPSIINFDNDCESEWSQFKDAMSMYMDKLEDPEIAIKCEFQLWYQKWQKVSKEDRPKSALAALDQCLEMCPNMSVLLQLLATLPITSCEAERLFSKMEKTLTAIRSTMGEERLEALLLLQVHRTLTPSITEVIDEFAKGSRRLAFTDIVL